MDRRGVAAIVEKDLAATGKVRSELSIAIVASFTAEPLQRPLRFWLEAAQLPAEIVIAPYAQVMQELLNPASVLGRNGSGVNAILVRTEDWIRERPQTEFDANIDLMHRAASELADAVMAFSARTPAPLFIFLMPCSSTLDSRYRLAVAEIETGLRKRVEAVAGVHCWAHADVTRLYPVSEFADASSDRLAHIPYTRAYFAAVAGVFARRIAALYQSPCKVIAVDCDNTLWKGVCGEDGVAGIELAPAHLEFQKALVRQYDAGVLICLCSKNNPEDVAAVLRGKPEMLLREEHIVASEVSWQSKSSGLQRLANQLDLSLESFVFIDDSAMECAEVQANCPSVLTIQFPQDPAAVSRMIDHTWAFDRVGVTGDARRRTQQYKENRARKLAEGQAGDFQQFLASLDLNVEISPMQPEQLPRVAELVMRTNQFNMTTMRRRASEIEAASRSGSLRVFVVNVRDRFGDYGLVGAVFVERTDSALDVDTFLLSCRVLGRGVEHRVVAELGSMAQREGLREVVLRYRRTNRNAPAREFLDASLAAFAVGSAEEICYTIPAYHASKITATSSTPAAADEENRSEAPVQASGAGLAWHARIAGLTQIDDVLREIDRVDGREVAALPAANELTALPLQAAVARILADVLGVAKVGAQDDFFDVGGDSVMAIQAISRIGSVLGLDLSVHEFFEGPTAETIAARLEQASQAVARIERAEWTGPAPLSWAQQRLWFIDQLEGGTNAYHIPLGIRIQGALDIGALQRALDRIVERHEALRTTFEQQAGQPIQRVAAESRFTLRVRDLSSLGEALSSQELRAETIEEVQAPFDLATGPLIRGRLLRLSNVEHLLLITMHHIVSDGWSIGVLIEELGALYGAFVRHAGDPLPPLPVQYRDYARWQREWITAETLQEQLQFWTAHLEGAPALLDLPTDRPRPAVQSYRGNAVGLTLDVKLTRQIKEFSRRQGLTLAMTLYAAWAIVLSRLSGQDDLVIGMPIANRRRTELESLIGFFVNTLAVRVQLSGDPTVEDLLAQVKASLQQAQANQDVPFEKIVEAVQPVRSLSHSAIFQAMFVFHNAPREPFALPGLRLVQEDVPAHTSRFDLGLALQEAGETISGALTYSSDLFNRETMERWTDCLKTVLLAVVSGSRRRVGQLPLMNEAERHRVLETFNSTRVAFPGSTLFHEAFERAVLRNPDTPAVIYDGAALTFAQLNGRANQLARHLRAAGLGPEQVAALCIERGIDMVVALLGVLKAGGAYLPLDPDYPPERLAYMLEDAAPLILITQERLRERLPPSARRSVILDSDWGEIAALDAGNLPARETGSHARQLAYVIYTSGSTGRPKGVMVEHRDLMNLLHGLQRIYDDAGPCERVAVNASLTFDSCIKQLVQLAAGRTLVPVPQEVRLDPARVADFLDENRVDSIDCTPLQLSAWMAAGVFDGARRKPHLVLVGGQDIDVALWRRLSTMPGIAFYNVYGPTECTVDATFARISGDAGPPHIGRPMENRRLYVLDRQLAPLPVGVPGELFIGGTGVARGYRDRPDLTAARFRADPFDVAADARMYRTGDVARWRPDGTIEYLRRNDDQVKIRGFRVELGEIEAQLAQLAQVAEVAVVLREDTSGDKKLVAYVVPRAPLTAELLKEQLRAVLPDYMVPTAHVTLEKLPQSPNGKVDRRALPAPELAAFVTRQYEPPSGDVEVMLAGIWQALLGVEKVGRNDNFFELGGHSLLIVQVLDRLRKVGLVASVRTVFESPTLAHLAAAVTREAERFEVPPNRIPSDCKFVTPGMLTMVSLGQEHIDVIARAVPGGMSNVKDVYPLVPLQEGILFHHLLDKEGGDTYVLPTVLTVSSRERLEELIAALQGAIDRHDILRTAVLWENLPHPLQVVYRQATLLVEEITLDRHHDARAQVLDLIKPERQRLDLRNAPLMRLQFAFSPRESIWYAVLQVHHVTSDHVTKDLVIEEVVAELEGRRRQAPEAVPYRNHVAYALSYSKLHDAEAFFRAKLGDVDEPTLPFGLGDVRGDGTRIEEAEQWIPEALARRLRIQARRLNLSPAALFHAAWGLVIAHTTGREDVVFGTMLLGRLQGDAGARRILGLFINMLPLRLSLRGKSVRELVELAQRELVDLLGHEQASLAIAQRCSGIGGSTPLFNSLFNFRHSTPNPEAQWQRAQGIGVVAIQERTNYPITMSVDDVDDGFLLTAQTDRLVSPARMIAYLVTALHGMAAALESGAENSASSVNILPDTERRLVLDAFNATAEPIPAAQSIHALFEEQVRRSPDAVALRFEGHLVTYRELNERANRLAHYLQDRGVGPGDLAAIFVERGVRLVVGLLGVLKTGAAYLPLDPIYPTDRIKYMLEDSGPAVLITERGQLGKLPESAAQVVLADDDWAQIALAPAENPRMPHASKGLRDLAYVIYTSGSTGKPKGVMVEHHGVVNFLASMAREPGINAAARLLAVTTISFDIAALELFLPLVNGAQVVLASRNDATDASRLIAMMSRDGVTHMQATPATWQMLLDAGWEGRPGMKAMCGGEALTSSLAMRLLPRVGTLWNLYGPTETTIWSCRSRVERGRGVPGVTESIGKPIANTRVYVLDARMQPVPVGVPGELYIGGVGVARGYLNRPDLTNDRFVSDPFVTSADARMYRTGDLAAWSEAGTLEYLGRNDHQVKIRGFRIELEEIEAQLRAHPQVRQAVVVAREDSPGDKRLVAYGVPADQDDSPDVELLRQHLRALLPEYMLPAAFVMLSALPLTPNGKVDRRSLPAPGAESYSSRQFVAPVGHAEQTLAAIWKEVLRVERVGREDDFFEIGGHSLLAMRVISRIREALHVDLPVRALFDASTVERLAKRLEAEAGAEKENLLQNIDGMDDEAVLERIAELEIELRQTGSLERRA